MEPNPNTIIMQASYYVVFPQNVIAKREEITHNKNHRKTTFTRYFKLGDGEGNALGENLFILTTKWLSLTKNMKAYRMIRTGYM